MADELGDKAGVRELGALISAHFANDRQKVAAIVEEQLKLAPEQIQALPMIENGYFNGEDVRLDGAIRMAPR